MRQPGRGRRRAWIEVARAEPRPPRRGGPGREDVLGRGAQVPARPPCLPMPELPDPEPPDRGGEEHHPGGDGPAEGGRGGEGRSHAQVSRPAGPAEPPRGPFPAAPVLPAGGGGGAGRVLGAGGGACLGARAREAVQEAGGGAGQVSGEDALSPEPRNLGRRWLGTEVQERTGCAGATRGWGVRKLRRADVARVEGRGPGAGAEEGQALNRQEGEVGKSCQNSSSCLGVVEQVGVTPAKGANIDARKMLILSVHFATHSS